MLTGLQIFKYLPAAKKAENTNCKKCGAPTCMAFALKLAKQQIEIEKCPFAPEELKEIFTETSKIQQHKIKLGEGLNGSRGELFAGGETVMFRHDKTFVTRTVIAVELDSDAPDFAEKLEKIKNYKIERIGETFTVDAVRLKGTNREAVETAGIPILDESIFVKGANPAELIKKSEAFGKSERVLELEYGEKSLTALVEELIQIRKEAILNRFEPLTYPVCVTVPERLNMLETCASASTLVCKYANIIVFEKFDEALLSTVMTLRQNIYTNPQKPLQVEAKIYEFNDPDENSTVFLTTNFALTYFAVAGELEALPTGSYLVVTPSDGMSVLTAWSADKFTAELVAKTVKNYELAEKVKNRSIIIPGLLSHMQGELSEAMPEWKIIVGSIEACQIPDLLKNLKDA